MCLVFGFVHLVFISSACSLEFTLQLSVELAGLFIATCTRKLCQIPKNEAMGIQNKAYVWGHYPETLATALALQSF